MRGVAALLADVLHLRWSTPRTVGQPEGTALTVGNRHSELYGRRGDPGHSLDRLSCWLGAGLIISTEE